MTVGQISTKIGNFIENRDIHAVRGEIVIVQHLLTLKIFKHA